MNTRQKVSDVGYAPLAVGLVLAVGIALTVWGVARTRDGPFAVQMYTAMAAFILGLFALVRAYITPNPNTVMTRYEDGIVKAGVIASTFWGIAGLLVGVIIASTFQSSAGRTSAGYDRCTHRP
jgi:cytochrome c oxidase cbb3-type subunit I